MAQLIVRNIEEEVVRALKQRAARRGVSAEAEHRAILKSTLLGQASSRSFKQALLAMPDVGVDTDFVVARDLDRRVELGAQLKPVAKRKRAARAKRLRG
jgi:plasmid stability protein